MKRLIYLVLGITIGVLISSQITKYEIDDSYTHGFNAALDCRTMLSDASCKIVLEKATNS